MDGPMIYRMDRVSAGGAGLVELDWLLVASGADRRGIDVLRHYAHSGVRLSHVILLEFEDRITGLTPSELHAQRRTFDDLGHPITRFNSSLDDPSRTVADLSAAGIDSGTVGLDMTLFPRAFLFWLLKFLREAHQNPEVTIYYTEPESYRYPSGAFSSYQATEGPLEVREVPGFPGMPRASSQSALTVLLGFDGQLATAVQEDISPRQTVVVNGFPSYHHKYKDISLVNNERIVSGSRQVVYAPADNPFETYNVLEKIRNENPDAFMTVAPLGTKPMALGACLFGIDHDEVRIVYPQPRGFVTHTTRDSWQSWRYDVDLGLSRGGSRSV